MSRDVVRVGEHPAEWCVLERDQRGHQLGGAGDRKIGARVHAIQWSRLSLFDQRCGADAEWWSGGGVVPRGPRCDGGGAPPTALPALCARRTPARWTRPCSFRTPPGRRPARPDAQPAAMIAPQAASATTNETAAAATDGSHASHCRSWSRCEGWRLFGLMCGFSPSIVVIGTPVFAAIPDSESPGLTT